MSEWISVDDRLPDDFETVAILEQGMFAHVGTYDMLRSGWLISGGFLKTGIGGVTHWLRLPGRPRP